MDEVHSIGSGSDHVNSIAGSCRSRPSRRRGRRRATFCGGGGGCCSPVAFSVASSSPSQVPSLLSVGQPLAAVARAPTGQPLVAVARAPAATAAAGARATSEAAAGTATEDERVSSVGMDLDIQEALEEELLGGAGEDDSVSSRSWMSSHGADPDPAAPGAGVAGPAAPGAVTAAPADAVVLFDSENARPSSSYSPGHPVLMAACRVSCSVHGVQGIARGEVLA